jgi:hypothetical protein
MNKLRDYEDYVNHLSHQNKSQEKERARNA